MTNVKVKIIQEKATNTVKKFITKCRKQQDSTQEEDRSYIS